ncbi:MULTISPECIES: GWxTD domain-containing protein [unclassified Ekhidna]|jgi:GWxTD domain-containing protein|uniref:GWxTD domain-containing protein n=1 Tax=unclassified Ekhidna TaxID=2632188 RepID=UPI0032DE3F03
MRKHVLIFSLFAFLVGFSANAINFSRVNVAWQYDVNFNVKMAHRVVSNEDELIVFLRVSADSIDTWTYEFLLQDGYESETHQIIQPIATDTLLDVSSQVLLRIRLSKADENLLVVKFSKPEQFYYYDIRLRIGSLSFPSIYPADDRGLPILEKYINRSGHRWIGNDTLIAMQYVENFAPADPPMADMKPLAPQVDMDTAFMVSNSPVFKENYFYTVRKDSLSTVGVTMLRVPPYYPEYRQLRELIESMLYLTSEQEKKAMLRSKNPKQSFDSFWMNTFSTKSRARNAIRKYYNWIENANELFTDFKPGWKTDRGMMYIVFGKPDEVYRTGSLEEWYYDDGAAFEFTIISTFFAPKTYSLRRDIEFEEQWYTQIAAIRRGIK